VTGELVHDCHQIIDSNVKEFQIVFDVSLPNDPRNAGIERRDVFDLHVTGMAKRGW